MIQLEQANGVFLSADLDRTKSNYFKIKKLEKPPSIQMRITFFAPPKIFCSSL